MRLQSRLRTALLVVATIAAAAPAALGAEPEATAAPSAPPSKPAEYSDRLFLSFMQEANLVPSQWWEGELEYADGNSDVPVDVFLFRGVVAFHPVGALEVGGNVGFGSTDSPGPFDGEGATDLNLYGKWVFVDVAQNLDLAAGLVATVPTGDDSAGLGFDAFALQGFGSIRYRFEQVELGGNVGVRVTEDGHFQNSDLQGKTSFRIAISALFPLASQVSLLGEAQFESDRFEFVDGDSEVLAGINWRVFGRGMLRGAVAAGFSKGAPDFRVIAAYAYTF
jgi:hypothetical protein